MTLLPDLCYSCGMHDEADNCADLSLPPLPSALDLVIWGSCIPWKSRNGSIAARPPLVALLRLRLQLAAGGLGCIHGEIMCGSLSRP